VHFGLRRIASIQGMLVITDSGRVPDLVVEGLGVLDHVGSSRLGSLTFDCSLLLVVISHLDGFVVSLSQGLDCPSQCLVRSGHSCYSILLISVEIKASILLLLTILPADCPAVEVEACPCADPFTVLLPFSNSRRGAQA